MSRRAVPWFTLALITAIGFLVAESLRADPPRGDGSKVKGPPNGKAIYEKQCAACHGPAGAGDGEVAYLLNPKPRNFQVGDFRIVSTQNGVPTDADLLQVLERGMPGSAMPSWGHLPRQDLEAVIGYVRRLIADGIRARLAVPEEDEDELTPAQIERAVELRTTPGDRIPVPAVLEATEALIAQGRDLYLQTCASCHGVDGRGEGIDVRYTSEGNPILPRDFTQGIFKGRPDPKDLFTRIRAGMPGTPMPSADFTDEEVWGLVHYVRSLRRPGAQARAEVRSQEISAVRTDFKDVPGLRDVAWEATRPMYVGLMPLWWRTQRIEGVLVEALHNGETLAIRLTWEDPTPDKQATAPQDFTDAAALQFSLDEDPPFFAMGDKSGMVNIWAWKAVRQEDLTKYPCIEDRYPAMISDRYAGEKGTAPGEHREIGEALLEKQDPTYLTGLGAGNPISQPANESPVEDLTASSQGTLTFQPPFSQDVKGIGQWEDGVWKVILHRPLSTKYEGDVQFSPGAVVSMALAVWDGSVGDRNGQKSVSIWQRLILQ